MQKYSYKEPLSFQPITFEELKKGDCEGVYLKGKASNYWIRQAPKFIDDPDGCSIFPKFEDQKGEYRQQFVLAVKDVTLVGVRTILDKHGNWFNDQSYCRDEYEYDLNKFVNFQDSFLNESSGFRPTVNRGVFTLEWANRIKVELKGKTLIGCCLEAANYGSWIFRVLPKMYAAFKMGLNCDRILIEYKQHKRLQEYFDLIGIDHSKLMQHDRNIIYEIEKAIIPSLTCSNAYLDGDAQEFYKFLQSKYGMPRKEEKIYVSRLSITREGKTTRVLQNETELIEALSKEGFKIIYPELLSPHTQIEVFSSASVVVGPSGSGMFNVAFCHPGTKLIDIESEPHWIHHHMSLFSSLKLDFGIFVGKVDPNDPTPVHKRWTVNIPALLTRIRTFCN